MARRMITVRSIDGGQGGVRYINVRDGLTPMAAYIGTRRNRTNGAALLVAVVKKLSQIQCVIRRAPPRQSRALAVAV